MDVDREPSMCVTEWPRQNTGDTGLVGDTEDKVKEILEPHLGLDCLHFWAPKRDISYQLHYLAGSSSVPLGSICWVCQTSLNVGTAACAHGPHRYCWVGRASAGE